MKLPILLVLGAIVAVALVLRIVPAYNQVITPDGVRFAGSDAYYQMRLVDIIANNFPRLGNFDPYGQYPSGMGFGAIYFFPWLIGAIAWLLGHGSPSQELIDLVGAYAPAVLGALVVLPVFFIARAWFNKWVGLIAAALVAILPGEFLGRSTLGYTDQHILEVLLFTTAVMSVVLALKSTGLKSIVYALAGGILVSLYILTWIGALLLVFIFGVYLMTQFVLNHVKREDNRHLAMIGLCLFIVPLGVSLLMNVGMLARGAFLGVCLAVVGAWGLSEGMTALKLTPRVYAAIVVGVVGLSIGVLRLLSPALFSSVADAFSMFAPSATLRTTLEAQPFSFSLVWGNFSTDFYLALVGLCGLIYFAVKRGDSSKILLLVWSIVMLVATIQQRRFAYYFAVNVALLASYTLWLMVDWLALRGTRTVKKGTKLIKVAQKPSPAILFTVSIIVFLVGFVWNISPALAATKQAGFRVTDGWNNALVWLKTSTTEPIGDSDAYYRVHDRSYKYPSSAYGVLAWWDYGYWITRIAHRIPNANPSQEASAVENVAAYLVAQDEKTGSELAKAMGTKYIVIDADTVGAKFWAITKWAGKQPSDYFGVYLLEGGAKQIVLFYPEYYCSLGVRLYNFNGQGVTSVKPVVISYRPVATDAGMFYGQVLSSKEFSSYPEAQSYVSKQKSGNWRIVSADPMVSPVPLEALGGYELIHGSNVKIFEFLGAL